MLQFANYASTETPKHSSGSLFGRSRVYARPIRSTVKPPRLPRRQSPLQSRPRTWGQVAAISEIGRRSSADRSRTFSSPSAAWPPKVEGGAPTALCGCPLLQLVWGVPPSPLCSVVPNARHDGQSASGRQDWRNLGCPQALTGAVPVGPANWLAVSCDTNLQTLKVYSKQAAEMNADLRSIQTGHGAQIRVPFPSE